VGIGVQRDGRAAVPEGALNGHDRSCIFIVGQPAARRVLGHL
jgi:hypothetical protein